MKDEGIPLPLHITAAYNPPPFDADPFADGLSTVTIFIDEIEVLTLQADDVNRWRGDAREIIRETLAGYLEDAVNFVDDLRKARPS